MGDIMKTNIKKTVDEIKREIQLKLAFNGYFIWPCWKCKNFKLNKKPSSYVKVFVCLNKISCKKWKKYKTKRHSGNLNSDYWEILEKTNNLIDDIYEKHKVRDYPL